MFNFQKSYLVKSKLKIKSKFWSQYPTTKELLRSNNEINDISCSDCYFFTHHSHLIGNKRGIKAGLFGWLSTY